MPSTGVFTQKLTVVINPDSNNPIKEPVDRIIVSPDGLVALLHLSQPHSDNITAEVNVNYTPNTSDKGVIYTIDGNSDSSNKGHYANVQIMGTVYITNYDNALIYTQGIDGNYYGFGYSFLFINDNLVGLTGGLNDEEDIHGFGWYVNLKDYASWLDSIIGPLFTVTSPEENATYGMIGMPADPVPLTGTGRLGATVTIDGLSIHGLITTTVKSDGTWNAGTFSPSLPGLNFYTMSTMEAAGSDSVDDQRSFSMYGEDTGSCNPLCKSAKHKSHQINYNKKDR